jgi:hypothetical protein
MPQLRPTSIEADTPDLPGLLRRQQPPRLGRSPRRIAPASAAGRCPSGPPTLECVPARPAHSWRSAEGRGQWVGAAGQHPWADVHPRLCEVRGAVGASCSAEPGPSPARMMFALTDSDNPTRTANILGRSVAGARLRCLLFVGQSGVGSVKVLGLERAWSARRGSPLFGVAHGQHGPLRTTYSWHVAD